MTTSSATEVFLAVSAELSRETPAHERFQRLLQGLRQVFPCDAAALLQLHESTLIPLAADGLSPDTLGRRFVVDEHRAQTLIKDVSISAPNCSRTVPSDSQCRRCLSADVQRACERLEALCEALARSPAITSLYLPRSLCRR